MEQHNDIDKLTESLFNIISAHFINVFYNVIYIKARDSASAKRVPITDAYKLLAREYINGMQNNESLYRQAVSNLCNYYVTHTQRTMMTFDMFEKYVLCIFVPAEFFESLTSAQRDKHFHTIIQGLVQSLGTFCLTNENLREIIDNRNSANLIIPTLKKRASEHLYIARENIYSLYIQVSTNQNANVVSTDVLVRIKAALKEELMEKNKYKHEANELKAANVILKKHLVEHVKQLGALKVEVEQLKKVNEQMQAECAELRQKLYANETTNTRLPHQTPLQVPSTPITYNTPIIPAAIPPKQIATSKLSKQTEVVAAPPSALSQRQLEESDDSEDEKTLSMFTNNTDDNMRQNDGAKESFGWGLDD